MALPVRTFYLTSTISYHIDSVDPAFTKRVNRSTITICRQYPRKLITKEWLHSELGEVWQGEPCSYVRLYAKTKARTRNQAASAMFADVELLLACLNLAYKVGRYVIVPSPVKPLRVSPA
jgi:hypothetical protein